MLYEVITRAPTVAFRISGEERTLFYAPDIVALPDLGAALAGVDLYVGDGAAFDASMQRVEEGQLCGHAPLPEQLAWCAAARVPQMRITHCGAALTGPDAEELLAALAARGADLGVDVAVMGDGETLELGDERPRGLESRQASE